LGTLRIAIESDQIFHCAFRTLIHEHHLSVCMVKASQVAVVRKVRDALAFGRSFLVLSIPQHAQHQASSRHGFTLASQAGPELAEKRHNRNRAIDARGNMTKAM
jgi:hypothetical protein